MTPSGKPPGTGPFEELQAKLRAGYDLDDTTRRSDVWLEAWRDLLAVCDHEGIRDIDEIDKRVTGVCSILDWIHDLDDTLHSASVDNRDHAGKRRDFCTEFLDHFSDRSLTTQNLRRALAESIFDLGDVEETDRLYREWLDADRRWGWGWIGWADCYWLFGREDQRDLEKAETILEEGRAVEEVEDRIDVLDRLRELYDTQGQGEKAEEVLRELEATRPQPSLGLPHGSPRGTILDAPVPIFAAPKAGRNDPCPCGSGKKFKKCCGKA